jgi:hypothetical protein
MHNVINPERRVGGPGLQGVVGRVPSRGGTSDVVYSSYSYSVLRSPMVLGLVVRGPWSVVSWSVVSGQWSRGLDFYFLLSQFLLFLQRKHHGYELRHGIGPGWVTRHHLRLMINEPEGWINEPFVQSNSWTGSL